MDKAPHLTTLAQLTLKAFQSLLDGPFHYLQGVTTRINFIVQNVLTPSKSDAQTRSYRTNRPCLQGQNAQPASCLLTGGPVNWFV